jgi:hypothetical protein
LWPLLQVMAGQDDIDGNVVPVPLGDPGQVNLGLSPGY